MNMLYSRLGTGALVATLLVAPACMDTPTSAQQAQATSAGSDQVVAEVDGRKITLKDVDDKWAEFDAAGKNKVTQELYQNRRNMIDQILSEAVLAKSAKAAGLTVDAYVDRESAKLVAPVTEADVKAFYEQNKDRAGGRTLDDLRKQVTDFLAGQRKQQARAMVVGNLVENEKSIKVMLDPPRFTVEVASNDPVLGESTAPITLVEYSDYQCPFCQRVGPTLKKVQQTYGNKVKIVYKDFPLPNHPFAMKAAEAAQCAGEQGKYWEMHDRMFADQRLLDVPSLKASAAALGMDAPMFNQCLDSSKFAAQIKEDMATGEKLGVNSTPSLYVNGRPIIGAQPFEVFKAAIDDELKAAKK